MNVFRRVLKIQLFSAIFCIFHAHLINIWNIRVLRSYIIIQTRPLVIALELIKLQNDQSERVF